MVNSSCLKLWILPFLTFQKSILNIGHIKMLMNMTEVHLMLSSPIKKIWRRLIRHLKAEIPYFWKIKFWSTFSQQVLTKSIMYAFVGKYRWKLSYSVHIYKERSTRVDLMLTKLFLLKTLHLKVSNAVSIVFIRLLFMKIPSIEVENVILQKCIFQGKIKDDKR